MTKLFRRVLICEQKLQKGYPDLGERVAFLSAVIVSAVVFMKSNNASYVEAASGWKCEAHEAQEEAEALFQKGNTLELCFFSVFFYEQLNRRNNKEEAKCQIQQV